MAKVNPFTALIEGGRDLISGQSFDALLVFGVALACIAVASRAWGVTRPPAGGGRGLATTSGASSRRAAGSGS